MIFYTIINYDIFSDNLLQPMSQIVLVHISAFKFKNYYMLSAQWTVLNDNLICLYFDSQSFIY